MSVSYLQPSSSQSRKRHRSGRNSIPLQRSKCGEIFVTPGWNKWTYNCTFCQLTTSDIGVFICHIRLQHSYVENKSNDCERRRKNNSSKRRHSNVQNHSNVRSDSQELDSETDSCSSVHESIVKEDETLEPIEVIPTNCMPEDDEDFLENHNTLQTTTEDTELPGSNNETICSKVSKIFNLETIIVRKVDEDDGDGGGGGGGEDTGDGSVDGNGDKTEQTINFQKGVFHLSHDISSYYVKEKLKSGSFQIITRFGRSKIWELFGKVIDNEGKTLTNNVACSKCFTVFKYDGRTTSNLWRHKCVKEIEYI